jgi:hypothetical protein
MGVGPEWVVLRIWTNGEAPDSKSGPWGSIPPVRAILALSNGNDATMPRWRCEFDSRRGVHLSGSSNWKGPRLRTW